MKNFIVEKCKYHNDAQTTCSLMIDDLVPVAIGVDDNFGPQNDWGYYMDKEKSLYNYFNNHLLRKFSEIKGTIFLPIDSHNYIPINQGYKVKNRGFDKEFLNFLNRISDRFEFAFHGIKHAWEDNDGKNIHEFRNLKKNQLYEKQEFLNDFSNKNNINFSGGKFPGYRYNNHALDFIKDNNFTWWSLDCNMLNNVSSNNDLNWDNDLSLVTVPTNLSGDIFKNYYLRNSKLRLISNLIKFYKISHPSDFIMYLYENRLPITIQEHFQNQTTNGRRQPINIFDDIWSLNQIFGLLRGLDIWYAKCGEITDYYNSYQNTEIEYSADNSFNIIYKNSDLKKNISLRLNHRTIIRIEDGQSLTGFRKNNYWIFNNILPGKYKLEL